MKMPDDLLRACTLANQLRGAVRQRVGLIASVGVGNKLVARMLAESQTRRRGCGRGRECGAIDGVS